ncbi:restriction endonuclease subunit S [Edwardsiella tarda]|uniref:restriction endonuclease subunit S n=1 Tax=Gammaproteobacteria TaxID=1236 RepID=UPI0024441BCE|nr:restriction endonuclease subunit S [Edwardsiella tarda]WGE30867.1 restriction endonuclease subunit S [Edwardsiella tarda]
MSQYRAYPAHKDSGIEWIGQVPEHWKVARVKRLASLRNERRNDVSTDTIYIGLEDVEAGSGQYKPTKGSSRQSEDSTVGIFYEGDVLYGKLRPYLRKAIISEMAGCCSTEFLVLRAENTEPRWLQEWLLTPDVTHQIESGCEGAKMPRADWGHIGSIEVVYPDQPEQAQILTTLDRETARIDALIEKKTRFIELLKEKRQALITHAVTKGLDPNAKMKDSGVEWIGQVPEHWEVKPICRVTSVNDDVLPDSTTDDTPIRYVDISSVGCMEGIKQASDMCFADAPSRARRKASSGDVIISTVRTYLKAVATVTDEYADCVFSTGFAVLRARHLDRSFLKWMVLNELLIQAIEAHSEGLSYPAINASALVKLKSVIPPPEEQVSIAATLERETVRIDALISKAEQSITLLKERRAAFITAAVTGQIDLRGKQ